MSYAIHAARNNERIQRGICLNSVAEAFDYADDEDELLMYMGTMPSEPTGPLAPNLASQYVPDTRRMAEEVRRTLNLDVYQWGDNQAHDRGVVRFYRSDTATIAHLKVAPARHVWEGNERKLHTYQQLRRIDIHAAWAMSQVFAYYPYNNAWAVPDEDTSNPYVVSPHEHCLLYPLYNWLGCQTMSIHNLDVKKVAVLFLHRPEVQECMQDDLLSEGDYYLNVRDTALIRRLQDHLATVGTLQAEGSQIPALDGYRFRISTEQIEQRTRHLAKVIRIGNAFLEAQA